MKNFDKFGGFSNNQIKTIIFMLIIVIILTEDLDYALEVLLPEVAFLVIKDLFSISSEEKKQYMLDGGIAYDRRSYQIFEAKVGRYEVFLFS